MVWKDLIDFNSVIYIQILQYIQTKIQLLSHIGRVNTIPSGGLGGGRGDELTKTVVTYVSSSGVSD